MSFSRRVPPHASRLRRVAATVEFYERVLTAFPDTESLTVLVASGVTREDALTGLGADVSEPVEDAWDTDTQTTAWAAIDVPGGVLAVEMTGYGDPALTSLASLSTTGASAVVRSNIQAHYRFGFARSGEVVFDDDEFIYADPANVPAELRELFDTAWVDLDDEDEEVSEDPFPAGLAMAELVTGVELTEDLINAVLEADFFSAPSLRYPGPEGGEDAPAPPVKVTLERGVRKVDDGVPWTTRDGLYVLSGSWDYMFEQEDPPPDLPEGFGLVVADHTAWVRVLSSYPVQVSLTALSSQVEPTVMLGKLRAAYSHEASGVILARDPFNAPDRAPLEAWGEPEHHCRSTKVTKSAGSFVLHVFGRRVDLMEEHVIVTWPAIG